MTETSKDAEKYISCSMINIDEYIHKRQFRQAFGLLILFLERLDGEEKAQETKAEKAEEKRRNALLETNAMSPPELKEMVAKVKKSLAKKEKKTKVKK